MRILLPFDEVLPCNARRLGRSGNGQVEEGQAIRILIAEDDPISRTILSATLKKGGHEVVMASNGVEGWEVMQEADAPMLVILDWIMPEMDGMEFVRRVRGQEFPLPPYIIMITGKSEKADIVSALALGANDILSKPCDPDVLLARVNVGRRMIDVQEKLLAQADELRETQAQLSHAQKLEAVGQLAAGIAHEINTPVQFVGDSVHFLKEAFEDQWGLIVKYKQAVDTIACEPGREELMGAIREAEETADLEYLEENVPGSLDRCIEGLTRISSIVCAMKEFAHPDQRDKSPADLNQALQTTISIARSEYKYVAEVETDLDEIPPVSCYVGDLNQVFLNLLVNAAHAIGDVVGDTSSKGAIRVRTSLDGDTVQIEIEDTGAGIPAAVRDRIYDPFFTTKEVGKGSGQGLAIARSIIVDKHGGSLDCESEEGKGTTFIIRLPVDGADERNTETVS